MIKFSRVGLVAATIFIIAVFVCGCAKQQLATPNVGTVRGFSTGPLKPPTFNDQPTAKQLYDALVKYYQSWNGHAVSLKETFNDDVDNRTFSSNHEYRFQAPDKFFHSSDGKNSSVMIQNGKHGIWYFINKGKYVDLSKVLNGKLMGGVIFQMGLALPADAKTIKSLRLLPETSIDGTKVYVLDIVFNPNLGRPDETTTLYVGETDLLPRREIGTQPGKTHKLRWENTFLGVKVDPKLPKGLFLTRPPEGFSPQRLNPVSKSE